MTVPVAHDAGYPLVPYTSLYVDGARPLPESAKPDHDSVTCPLAGAAPRPPLLGDVWSSRIDADAVADTLPAASMNHA